MYYFYYISNSCKLEKLFLKEQIFNYINIIVVLSGTLFHNQQ